MEDLGYWRIFVVILRFIKDYNCQIDFMKMFILFFLMLLALASIGQVDSNSIAKRDDELEKVKLEVKEIRRDQLNYKIEKDLLKETYSTNYSMIQIFISIILGVFAILAYLGLKSIMSLKKEYDTELGKLKEVKLDFESQLKALTDSQTKVETQIKMIDILNETQNSKIRILEIREKVNTLYAQNNYPLALEYVNAGLDLAKDDLQLLVSKAKILNKAKSFSEAVEAYKKVLSIDPRNESISLDLAELYLIVNQPKAYEAFSIEIMKSIESKSEYVRVYFDAFKFYRLGEIGNMKSVISNYLKGKDLTINQKLDGWGFAEFHEQITKEPSSEIQKILIAFVNYLEGLIIGQDLQNML